MSEWRRAARVRGKHLFFWGNVQKRGAERAIRASILSGFIDGRIAIGESCGPLFRGFFYVTQQRCFDCAPGPVAQPAAAGCALCFLLYFTQVEACATYCAPGRARNTFLCSTLPSSPMIRPLIQRGSVGLSIRSFRLCAPGDTSNASLEM